MRVAGPAFSGPYMESSAVAASSTANREVRAKLSAGSLRPLQARKVEHGIRALGLVRGFNFGFRAEGDSNRHLRLGVGLQSRILTGFGGSSLSWSKT